MATMITNDCINCGACEPECPNNAISQGDPVFVIDPKLCTECVGFHDYEACAAVCPVDVCVTDPNNIETEEALIARARSLHPETNFPDNFESRFRKGQGKPAAASGPAQAAPATTGAPAPAATPPTPAATASTAAAPASGITDVEVNYVHLPEIDSWDIPLQCFKCNEVHVENVKNFAIGNVIFCPNCNKSIVVRDNLNYHIRTLLKESYDKWEKDRSEFASHRARELAEFLQRRKKEAEAFENRQKRELQNIRQQLEAIGENYDAAGKPFRKGSRFAWG